LRCVWCDTEYAFQEGERTTVGEVLAQLTRWPCRLVELTGGEPLAQAGARPLMKALLAAGYEVLLETSGALPVDGVPAAVIKIMDVKCPGSGEVRRNRLEHLAQLGPRDEVKFVIADEGDFHWAAAFCRTHRIPERWATLFSPVHGKLAPEALAEWILREGLSVRLQLPLHKILWPAVARGV
jgi:7-carboxy-7-deazaguanine synthase